MEENYEIKSKSYYLVNEGEPFTVRKGTKIEQPKLSNTIRIVRTGATHRYYTIGCQSYECFLDKDTVLLKTSELSVNPCEGCANSDSSRRYWNCNHDCRKYVGYQAEQALIAKLKEASK